MENEMTYHHHRPIELIRLRVAYCSSGRKVLAAVDIVQIVVGARQIEAAIGLEKNEVSILEIDPRLFHVDFLLDPEAAGEIGDQERTEER